MEIGAGSGPSFEHYPVDVESVLALEPDNHLRRLAQQAATSSPVPVTVSAGTAEHLPAEDETIDAVVCSLVLCSVADQATALEEIRRVLRPGGLFAYYEHVRSEHRLIAHAQDTGAGLWSVLAGGCHPNRDTVKAVAEAGLITVSLKRFGFRVHPAAPPVAHVIALARKP